MPDSDLILSVRQISGYPNLGIQPTDNVLIQRGGLGGPYLSVNAQQLVGQALAAGGPMSVGNPAPADTEAPQMFTDGLGMVNDGQLMWNCYVGGGQEKMVLSGPGARIAVVNGDMYVQAAAPTGAGTIAQFTDMLVVDPTGYVTVGNQVLLARDPAGPLEAATAQFVENVVAGLRAATVASFNGRTGPVRLWIQDILAAGGAPQFSPVFGGEPRAPTPPPWSCNSRLATTAFVQRNFINGANHLLADHPFVFTFNGRTGDIVLTQQDIVDAGGATLPYAPIDSPAFTGYPTAPTAPPGSQTAQLATTAFVMNAVQESTTGVASFNGRTGIVTLSGTDVTNAGGALLASPVFTGTPQAPTAAPGTDTAQLATCAWVINELGGVTSGVQSFNGRAGAVTLTLADVTGVGGAPLASPAFNGVPTAPTAPTNTSTQQLATTAFVMTAVTAGSVVSFNGRTGAVTLTANDLSAASGITNPSPALLGTPTAPTASPGTSSTQVATCAFVAAALAAAPGVLTFNSRSGAVTLTNADVITVLPASTVTPLINGTASLGTDAGWSRGDHVHPTDTSRYSASNPSGFQTASQVATALAAYLPVANPAFTGTLTGGTISIAGAMQAGGGVYPSYTTAPDFLMSGNATNRGIGFRGAVYNLQLNNTAGTLIYLANSVQVMSIDFSGNMAISGALSQGSDLRGKRDVSDATEGLDEVRNLKPKHYVRVVPPPVDIVAPRNANQIELGFVAQEVEEALPLAVRQDNEGNLSVSLMPLIATLVNAIKELDRRTAALEAAA